MLIFIAVNDTDGSSAPLLRIFETDHVSLATLGVVDSESKNITKYLQTLPSANIRQFIDTFWHKYQLVLAFKAQLKPQDRRGRAPPLMFLAAGSRDSNEGIQSRIRTWKRLNMPRQSCSKGLLVIPMTTLRIPLVPKAITPRHYIEVKHSERFSCNLTLGFDSMKWWLPKRPKDKQTTILPLKYKL